MTRKWIQQANIKKGALHKQLGYPTAQHIPPGLMQRIQKQGIGSHVQTPKGSVAVTTKLKRRVNFALNMRGPR